MLPILARAPGWSVVPLLGWERPGEACLEDVAETARRLRDAPSTFLLSHRTLALSGTAGYSDQCPQVLALLAARFDPVTKSWPIR